MDREAKGSAGLHAVGNPRDSSAALHEYFVNPLKPIEPLWLPGPAVIELVSMLVEIIVQILPYVSALEPIINAFARATCATELHASTAPDQMEDHQEHRMIPTRPAGRRWFRRAAFTAHSGSVISGALDSRCLRGMLSAGASSLPLGPREATSTLSSARAPSLAASVGMPLPLRGRLTSTLRCRTARRRAPPWTPAQETPSTGGAEFRTTRQDLR